jgi:hypothetical protein
MISGDVPANSSGWIEITVGGVLKRVRFSNATAAAVPIGLAAPSFSGDLGALASGATSSSVSASYKVIFDAAPPVGATNIICVDLGTLEIKGTPSV